MRRVLPFIVLGILGVGFLVDVGAREVTEQSVADALKTSLRLSETPDVSISGWPFLVRALKGEFPEVTLSGGGISRQGLKLVELRAELRDVEYSLGDDVATVASGSGRASITEQSLNKELARAGVPARVTLDGTSASVTLDEGTSLQADISLSGSRLVVRPEVGEPMTLLLPPLMEGVTYSSVSVADSRVNLELTIDQAEFEAV